MRIGQTIQDDSLRLREEFRQEQHDTLLSLGLDSESANTLIDDIGADLAVISASWALGLKHEILSDPEKLQEIRKGFGQSQKSYPDEEMVKDFVTGILSNLIDDNNLGMEATRKRLEEGHIALPTENYDRLRRILQGAHAVLNSTLMF